MTAVPSTIRFRKFALFCLCYNVGVILWGAYVRASGSGAGCGSHWPLCNGQIIPRPERIQTLVEYAHRLSSGLCLVFAIILMGWAWRLFPKAHLARRAANWTFGLTISEALVGAGLVLLSLVDHDKSVDRAVSISIHLINTLFLVGALTLTVRWSWKDTTPSLQTPDDKRSTRWITASVFGTLLLGVTGTLTALGDTLFRSTSLKDGWNQDFAQDSHFLLKLRIIHPSLAVGMALLLYLFAEFCHHRSHLPASQRWTRLLQLSLLLQMMAGAMNLLLLAPIFMQIVHLLLADLTWISLVMVCAAMLETSSKVPTPLVSPAHQLI